LVKHRDDRKPDPAWARRIWRSVSRFPAAGSGRRVYYGTLGDLIASLDEAQVAGRLSARMKTFV
jgi:hypothetical protein